MSMRTAILATFLLSAAPVLHANVELTIAAQSSTIPVKDFEQVAGEQKAPEKRTIHLTIGTTWVHWDDGTDRGVYDVAKRVIIHVDPKEHRLYEESLYATVSGREGELDNRLMLGETLKAGDVKDNPMSPTIAEHQLSIRHDASRPSEIERKHDRGEQLYLWNKKELFAHSNELVPLPAASRDLYLRFVRYLVGAHPEIFDDLRKLDGIPKWLRRTDPTFGNIQRLEVLDVKKTPDAPYTLPALEKTAISNPAAAAAAAVVRASTPESRAAAVAKLLAAANKAAETGKPLEAILGYLEIHLMTGELPPDLKERASTLTQNADVTAFLSSTQVSSEDEAKKAVATLTRLASVAGDKAYVTSIFRANMEHGLGNAETAVTLFVEALTKNPFITGAWKDLGNYLDIGYDAVDSWRCYEVARLIAPKHPLLGDIDRREAELLKNYPEYF